MITTHHNSEIDVLTLTGSAAVTVPELVAAIAATVHAKSHILWDFRCARLDVPLNVVASPCYPPIRERINATWQAVRSAFVVDGYLQRHMIELFSREGSFTFPHQIFFDLDSAHAWLQPAQRTSLSQPKYRELSN